MFKKALALILIGGLVSPAQAWANCPEDIQVIEKGQTANCSGLLFSPEASKKADEAVDDRDYYKSLSEKYRLRSDLYSKEVNILEQRVDLHMNQSQELAKELDRRENQSTFQKIIYFGLGVGLTGLAIYAGSKVTN